MSKVDYDHSFGGGLQTDDFTDNDTRVITGLLSDKNIFQRGNLSDNQVWGMCLLLTTQKVYANPDIYDSPIDVCNVMAYYLRLMSPSRNAFGFSTVAKILSGNSFIGKDKEKDKLENE